MRKNNSKKIQEETFVDVTAQSNPKTNGINMENISDKNLVNLQEDSSIELERQLYNE